MPKKGKGAGKGKKGKGGGRKEKGETVPKKKLPKVTDGLHTSEMSKNQLLGFISRLLKENDRELEERNLFMLEKSKLWSLWQLTMDKLSMLKEEVYTSKAQVHKSEKGKDEEKEFFNKKLRFKQNEEVRNFGLIRLNHLHYTKKLSDDIWEIENVLREGSLAKKRNIRKTLASYYEILRGLRSSHAQSMSDMLLALSRSISQYEKAEDRKLFSRKSTWEENYLPYFDSLRILKHQKTDGMHMAHERSLLEMKTFFDDVFTNNLAVMTMVAEEIDLQKLQENRLKRDLRWAKDKYHKIHGPLQEMIEETKTWAAESNNERKLLRGLVKGEKSLKEKEHCLHMLGIAIECIRQQIAIAVVDRDRARVEFSKTTRNMQRQAQMTSVVYQLKTQAANKDTELFQAVSSVQSSVRQRHFDQLKRQRDRRMRAYSMTTNLDVEQVDMDQPTMQCLEKKRADDLRIIGLVNKSKVIRRPWLEPAQILRRCTTMSRSKQVLNPNYIFSQLPPLQKPASVSNENESAPSRISTASTTPMVQLFSNKLTNISSTKRPTAVVQVHESRTQAKLNKLLDKAEFRAKSDPQDNCANRLPPIPVLPARYPEARRLRFMGFTQTQPWSRRAECFKK